MVSRDQGLGFETENCGLGLEDYVLVLVSVSLSWSWQSVADLIHSVLALDEFTH